MKQSFEMKDFDYPTWISETAEAIEAKLYKVAGRSRGIIPYTTAGGRFDNMRDSNICWWTNGFWGGMMWQLYQMSGKEIYRSLALENEELLDANLMDPYGMDHDSGFKWLPTAAANYKIDGNQRSFRRTLLAAENMAGRFNPSGNYIRAWNDPNDGSTAGTAIIDCMMNLPLLYWAYEETKDPRFYHVAMRHADTTMQYFIRGNGSAIHIGRFNPYNGDFLESVGGQGYAQGSSWTRGQAWALYGFTLSWQHTHKEEYLKTAQRVADYFISQMDIWKEAGQEFGQGLSQEAGLELGKWRGVPIDFNQPWECVREDSSAAAIAACGLLELSRELQANAQKAETENSLAKKYRMVALELLDFLCHNRLSLDENVDYLLWNCADCYHSQQEQMTLIYADYFLIEALWKLLGKGIRIW